jgi:hypothetical protein
LDAVVGEVAGRQHGVVSLAQLKALGVPRLTAGLAEQVREILARR